MADVLRKKMRIKMYLLAIIATISMLINCCFCGPTKPMTGIHLRIGAVEEIPTMKIVKQPNGTNLYIGFIPNIINVLSERLNFTYTYVDVPKNLWQTTGPANASIYYLLQGNHDLVSTMTIPTVDRMKVLDFTYPLVVQRYRIVQPMPQLESPLLAIITPFRPLVWFCIFLFLAVVIATFTFFNRYESVPVGSTVTAMNSNILYVLVVLLGQGGSVSSVRLPFRMVAAVFCLMAVVLVNTYNGALTSRLSAPKYDPIVNSLEELAGSEHLHLAVSKGTVITDMFLNAKSGSSQTLGNDLRAHPEHIIPQFSDLMKKLMSGCCAHPAIDGLANVMVASAMTPSGTCTLTNSGTIDFYQLFSFASAKGAPWMGAMNIEIGMMWDNGLLPKWVDDITKIEKIKKCRTSRLELAKNKGLTLNTLSSAFLILGVGLAVSLLVFVGENLLRCRGRVRSVKRVQVQIEEKE